MKIGPCVGGIEEGQTTKERRELNHYYYSTPPSVVGRLMMDKIRGVEEMGELYSFLCLKSRHELKTHYCNECCSIFKCDGKPCPEYHKEGKKERKKIRKEERRLKRIKYKRIDAEQCTGLCNKACRCMVKHRGV